MNPREQVDAVMQASAASGRHYRDSIPMIASENILSPLVAEAFKVTFMGVMRRVYLASDIIRGATILILSKALGLNLQNVFLIANLQTYNRLLVPYQIWVP